MKHLFSLVLSCMVALTTFAQIPAGYPGAGKGNPGIANIGHLYGKVIDSVGKPLSDASVVLMQTKFDTIAKKQKEFLLKGIITKANGEFSFEEIPITKPVTLKISISGFSPFEQKVSFMPVNGASGPPSFDKDLGKIKLKTDVQQLTNVTVTGTGSRLKMDIDKKVFNVDKNIVSSGGTALDVMKNVPSVQVDIDGNVKMRNATPQLFVEGRPSTLTLDQIPADAIESVEVITNPSAKYDASGGNAGILNIILKKNRKSGYNGNLRAGIDKRGAINAGADLNARQGKLNISGSTMVNQMKNITTGTTDMLNLFETPQRSIHQESYNKTTGAFVFGKLGLDYFVSNKTTLSLNGIKVHGSFKPTDAISSVITSGGAAAFANRDTRSTRDFNASGMQFGLKHLFPKAGEELTADANYFSGKSSFSSNFFTDSMNAFKNIYWTEEQKVASLGTNKNLTLQTDYVKPITAKTKIEAGLRVNIRSIANDNQVFIQTNNTGEFKAVPTAANNYSNKDNVYAAYTTVTSSIKDFGYQLGLRAERSDYTGNLLTTGDKFSYQYPVSLFPSVFLSQKLKSDQQLQLNYSRRINRPSFFNMIPYTDRTDPLNITRGNPELVPEFTNSLEASYSKRFNSSNNILASVYYKSTTNLITRFQQKEMDPILEKEVLINTFINANSSYSYGAELTSINAITKWWDVTANINLYNSKINTTNITGSSQPALFSWFGKVNNTFKLPANFNVQVSANYQSKTNLPVNTGTGGPGGGGFGQQPQSASQGYIRPFYAVDLAIRKNFLKNNAASATLSFSDIFRTRVQEQHSESAYFIQDYSRLRDPQMIRLTLSYRFGKMDMSLFKRKNMNTNNAQGATEGMGM